MFEILKLNEQIEISKMITWDPCITWQRMRHDLKSKQKSKYQNIMMWYHSINVKTWSPETLYWQSQNWLALVSRKKPGLNWSFPRSILYYLIFKYVMQLTQHYSTVEQSIISAVHTGVLHKPIKRMPHWFVYHDFSILFISLFQE